MYIHEEIQLAVLRVAEKHKLGLLDMIGEMNHAAWEFAPLNARGIQSLYVELKKKKKVKA